MMVVRWQTRNELGRVDAREALAGSYSSSSYFSNPVNEFSVTYLIELIEGFSVE